METPDAALDFCLENDNDNSQKLEGSTPASPVVSENEIQEVNKPSGDGLEDGECANPVEEEDSESKSSNRRSVTFPGENLVAGYLEPPDPWKDVQHWTPDDLITAYKDSCKRHNTKPINSILNQLHGIENVGERFAILSLKGEKLDMKNVETLEEIFKLVQFQCVDLEGTHLDEETSVAIFEMIEYYESACKVNISFNKNISIRGWQSCAKMMRKTPCLTFLDARSCDINERLLPIVGRALRMGCFIKILHLENTNLSGRALVILVAALKMNEILKELFLADNKLMPTDGIQLGSLLKYNHVLELLDLRNNNLQDIGVGHISDGLYEQNLGQGLNTIVLWNNQMSYQAMSAISRSLSSTRSIETLNIGHNNITNEGIHLLKDGLLQNKSLLRLGLQGTKITCEGSVALAEVIADNPRLVRIDLRENDIKTAGLMALSLALNVNNILQRLDIDRETKKETGIKDYADQQKRLQQDINKKLEENRAKFYQSESANKQEKDKDKHNGSQKNDGVYIESCDKVKRPMLLVMPEVPPQMALDSPHCKNNTEEFIQFSNSVITTPPSELLLSPQYTPSVKARKIFTVSKVNNSPLSPVGTSVSILPPAMNVTMSISNSLPVLPLQPVLVASSDGETSHPSVNTTDPDCINVTSVPNIEPLTVSDITNTLVDESVNHILHQIICDEPSEKTEVSIVDQETETPVAVLSDKQIEKDINSDTNDDRESIETTMSNNVQLNDANSATDNSSEQCSIANDQNDQVFHNDNDAGDHDTSPSYVNDSVQKPSEPCSKQNSSLDQNSELNAADNMFDKGDNSCTSLTNGCDLLTSRVKDSDSGIGSFTECEQWTNVGDSIQPNFQTSLTFNGLTKELASAIEGLEGSPEAKLTTDHGRIEVSQESLQ